MQRNNKERKENQSFLLFLHKVLREKFITSCATGHVFDSWLTLIIESMILWNVYGHGYISVLSSCATGHVFDSWLTLMNERIDPMECIQAYTTISRINELPLTVWTRGFIVQCSIYREIYRSM